MGITFIMSPHKDTHHHKKNPHHLRKPAADRQPIPVQPKRHVHRKTDPGRNHHPLPKRLRINQFRQRKCKNLLPLCIRRAGKHHPYPERRRRRKPPSLQPVRIRSLWRLPPKRRKNKR